MWCTGSSWTKRALIAGLGVVGLIIWTIQLINAVSIDYKNGSITSNNVNPGTLPGSPALNPNVWFVLVPLVVLTLAVMATLARWIVTGAKSWMIVHVVFSIVLGVTSAVVLIAASIVFLVDSKWTKTNNLAADERLCCIHPSYDPSFAPVIPGCPHLFNVCSPDVSGLNDADMHWNGGFLCFFVLLFIDFFLGLAMVLITFWVGTSAVEDGKGYSTIQSELPITQTAQVGAMHTGVNIRTIVPIGTSASISTKTHNY